MSLSPAVLEAPAQLDVVLESFDLKTWRWERLGQMKRRLEYRQLAPILQQVVDYVVRRHESPDEGITVSQAKLAKRFGVHEDTMGKYLRAIVAADVLTRDFRGRKGCFGQRGRTTNRYRLNEILLSAPETDDRINHRVKDRSGSTSLDVHVEAPSRGHSETPTVYSKDEDQGFADGNPGGEGVPNELALKDPASSTTTQTTIASVQEPSTIAPLETLTTEELRERWVERWWADFGHPPVDPIPTDHRRLICEIRKGCVKW